MAKETAEQTLVEHLQYLIDCSKQCLISEAVKQLMPVLEETGFKPKHLIEGLADYFDEQKNLDQVVRHLELISELLEKAQRRNDEAEPPPLEADMN
jgi:hypothetical protein